MPIYEYRCGQCGHIFEKLQSLGADNSGLNCPKCNTPRPGRIFSKFASNSGASENLSSVSTGSSCGNGRFT